MARLPGWMVLDIKGVDADGVIVIGVRARRWHPSYWLALLRRWWQSRLEVKRV